MLKEKELVEGRLEHQKKDQKRKMISWRM